MTIGDKRIIDFTLLWLGWALVVLSVGCGLTTESEEGSGSDESPTTAQQEAVAAGTNSVEGDANDATDPADPAFDPAESDTGYYAREGWPAIHRDGRNSDTALVANPSTDLSVAHRLFPEAIIGAVLTTDSTGQLYVTTAIAEGPCRVFAIDPDTGETNWCLDELTGRVVSSSVTVDLDDNIYIADDAVMASYTPEGERRWARPVDGNPLSAQFTPDGHLIFISHIGHIYIVDRADGELLFDLDLLPDVEYDPANTNGLDCLTGGADSTCFSANTLAVDPDSGRIYYTWAPPGDAIASLVAMDYEGGDSPSLNPRWENESLDGGGAASPTISADGDRIYTNDKAGNLLALSADDGSTIWSYDLGFSPAGSPSVTDDGWIVPTAGGLGPVMTILDSGPVAKLVWKRDDLVHRGVPARATPGGPLYAVTIDADNGEHLDLVVLDPATGETLDSTPLEGFGAFTIGTTIGPEGNVYTASFTDGVAILN